MIRASLLTEENRYLFYGASANKGYVTFATRTLQQITLRGARVTGTRGLGYDLLAHQTEGTDPLVTPTPPARWPSRITRVYTFPGGDSPQGVKMVFDCVITREGPASATIVQVEHRGIQFSETCQNEDLLFENLYLADINSGYVWRSLQWIGPRMGNVDIEIIEPYTGD
jgi:Group 4 capsule polysaccharide lipoprotein gfcB, YjbF